MSSCNNELQAQCSPLSVNHLSLYTQNAKKRNMRKISSKYCCTRDFANNEISMFVCPIAVDKILLHIRSPWDIAGGETLRKRVAAARKGEPYLNRFRQIGSYMTLIIWHFRGIIAKIESRWRRPLLTLHEYVLFVKPHSCCVLIPTMQATIGNTAGDEFTGVEMFIVETLLFWTVGRVE